uniref:non-specific serine/threonine protein kinase n=1 Tax=Oryza nivara TaxID=4536 RepID=A0A0E0G3S7_ORYNI
MNLTGTIPDDLSSLTELTLLDLSQNKMQGQIPEWVLKHQKLENLYLYASNLSGEIGPNITALNLQELDLSMNKFSGSIPEDIANLKKLRLLYLYYNNLTGPIPAGVGMMPNLTDIRLFNNKLSGPLPAELGKHSELGNFEVSNNNLSGELPDTLCFNKKLYDIVVFNNNFSGVFPANLGDCETINNVMAYNNHFVGDFPKKIWSFAVLTNVMIYNNNFTGTLPSEISFNISRIEMENNRFSGALPSAAVGLKSFTAENNQFFGELPTDMSRLANLTELNLAGNQLSGSIPPSIKSLTSLTSLNLSRNQISGEIPAAVGWMGLYILDLSDNELTGDIPQDFSNLHLNFLNLSSNQLSGEVPDTLQNSAYDRSFLGNHGLCATVNMNMNLPACPYQGRNKLSTSLIIVFSVLAGVVFIGAVAIWLLILRHQKRWQDLTVWKMTSFRKLDFSECDVLGNLHEENVIGSGGSGKVYRIHVGGKGSTGKVVAVKRLWRTAAKSDAKSDKEFDAEVRILGEARHINIIDLLCCISGDDTKLLVYEYMENGSLDRWLHRRDDGAPTAPLQWPTRLCVAIDAARGLCYMHHECVQPIMHRDVKSSNILLDPGFRAKIADFGLARILVKSGEPNSVSAISGTFGYMAPEYGCRAKANEKVDVYAFGIVLLELTTGQAATDDDYCNLVDWAWRWYKASGALHLHDVIDMRIPDRAAFLEDAVAVFLLGVSCIRDDPASRPTMKEVLEQLVHNADYIRNWGILRFPTTTFGELPDTLCFNKKLFDIVVFNNSFSGVFPTNLGDCKTINNIMAYNNHFVGDFPKKIWSFELLTNVMIYNNFTGTLPSEISFNILRIEMGNNRFSGALPSAAVGLKSFLAENNQFSGELPTDMSRLANLTKLNLAGNQLLTIVKIYINNFASTLPSNKIVSKSNVKEIGLQSQGKMGFAHCDNGRLQRNWPC